MKQLYWDISDMYRHSRLHRATLWAKQHPKTNHEQCTARRPYPNAATPQLSKIFGSVHCPVRVHTEAWPIAGSRGPLFDKMISFIDLPTKHWEWHGYVICNQIMIGWLGQCYGLWQIYTVDRWVDKATCTWWARLYRVYIPMIITTLQSIYSVQRYEKNKEKDGDKNANTSYHDQTGRSNNTSFKPSLGISAVEVPCKTRSTNLRISHRWHWARKSAILHLRRFMILNSWGHIQVCRTAAFH